MTYQKKANSAASVESYKMLVRNLRVKKYEKDCVRPDDDSVRRVQGGKYLQVLERG